MTDANLTWPGIFINVFSRQATGFHSWVKPEKRITLLSRELSKAALTFYEVHNFNVIIISHQSSIHLKERSNYYKTVICHGDKTPVFFQPEIQNPFPDHEVGKVKPWLLSLLLNA